MGSGGRVSTPETRGQRNLQEISEIDTTDTSQFQSPVANPSCCKEQELSLQKEDRGRNSTATTAAQHQPNDEPVSWIPSN